MGEVTSREIRWTGDQPSKDHPRRWSARTGLGRVPSSPSGWLPRRAGDRRCAGVLRGSHSRGHVLAGSRLRSGSAAPRLESGVDHAGHADPGGPLQTTHTRLTAPRRRKRPTAAWDASHRLHPVGLGCGDSLTPTGDRQRKMSQREPNAEKRQGVPVRTGGATIATQETESGVVCV